MKPLETLLLAFKDFKSGGVRALLVTFSVVVGAAALIAFVAQAEGLRYSVEEQFRGLAANVIVLVKNSGYFSTSDIEALKGFKGVVDVLPALKFSATVMTTGKTWAITFVGMSKNTFLSLFPMAKTHLGELLLVPGTAVEGYRVLTEAMLPPGTVVFVYNKKYYSVLVTGALKPLGNSLLGFDPDTSIIISLDTASEIVGPNKYNLLYVVLENPSLVKKVFKTIEAFAKSREANAFAPLNIINMYMSAANFAERFLLVMSLMAFVASGFGIANTMMITVMERRSEIAIMKAVGFTPRDIMVYYLMLALTFGIVGGLLGVVLGYFLAGVINNYVNVISAQLKSYIQAQFIKHAKAYVSPQLMLEALLFSLITAIVAGLYPAMKAARLDPIEALRGE